MSLEVSILQQQILICLFFALELLCCFALHYAPWEKIVSSEKPQFRLADACACL
jgi:hypothetical protein